MTIIGLLYLGRLLFFAGFFFFAIFWDLVAISFFDLLVNFTSFAEELDILFGFKFILILSNFSFAFFFVLAIRKAFDDPI